MHYRILGKSGLKISEIGLGCMSIPAGDEVMGIKIMHRAIELGINYFDTADIYDKGVNESIVGKALKGKRDKVILATKVGNQWKADGSGFVWNPRKEYILATVEGSLERLQTDHIDLYQLHGGMIEDAMDETIEAFELLKTQGKIRHYGISSIRPNVIREYVKRSNIVSVMMQYSLADRRPEEEMLDFLHTNNIGVLARGSLAQGMLVNKPAKEYLGHTAADMEKGCAAIHSLVKKNRTAAQVAIRYVLQHPVICAAVIGISKIAQLEEIAGTSESDLLTLSDMKILQHTLLPRNYEQHR